MNYKFWSSNLLWILLLLRNHFSWYQLIFLMATSDIYCYFKISVSARSIDSDKECLLYFIGSRNFRMLLFVPISLWYEAAISFPLTGKAMGFSTQRWLVQHF